MNPTVTVLVGPPASGKSTYAKKAIKENDKLVRLNRDDFRMSFFGKEILSGPEEKRLTGIIKRLGRDYLKAGFSLILDNTHCNLKTLQQVELDYNDLAIIDYIPFDVELPELLKRSKEREQNVPDIAIRSMHKNFQHISGSFPFIGKPKKELVVLPQDGLPVYVFDIDQTLARKGNRAIFDFKRSGGDSPINPITKIAAELAKSSNLIFLTGRGEEHRDVTVNWLKKHVNLDIQEDQLFMRQKGDLRSSEIYKEEIMLALSEKFKILAWFDDDERVIELAKSYGILTCQISDESIRS